MIEGDASAPADVVILAVPVQRLRGALEAVAPTLKPGAVVCDVCSVKTGPCALLEELVPPHAHALGTHPLFGPETVGEVGLRGQTVALCPVRIDPEKLAPIDLFLRETLGLRTVTVTPDEHDRQMAMVQVVTHLIGRAASAMGLPELPLSTLAYDRLMQMKRNTERDAPELFDAIQTMNPHAAEMRARWLDAVRSVCRDATSKE